MENWVTKIATNDAMPSGSMSLIELLLYVLCYIFLYIVLLKCLIKTPEETGTRSQQIYDTYQQTKTK